MQADIGSMELLLQITISGIVERRVSGIGSTQTPNNIRIMHVIAHVSGDIPPVGDGMLIRIPAGTVLIRSNMSLVVCQDPPAVLIEDDDLLVVVVALLLARVIHQPDAALRSEFRQSTLTRRGNGVLRPHHRDRALRCIAFLQGLIGRLDKITDIIIGSRLIYAAAGHHLHGDRR